MPLAPELTQQLRSLLGPEGFTDARVDCVAYGFNSFPAYTEPAAVCIFKDKEQIRRVVPLLYERGVPMVIRGSGTNLVGAGLAPVGGVVLSLERMRDVLWLDPLSRTARVQAGANLLAVQQRAQAAGLLFPPNPGNVDAVTIGGIIGCNSSGDLAFGFGQTSDYVVSMEMVLFDGSVVELQAPLAGSAELDLVRLVVGAEGTLGLVTEATLRFVPQPLAQASAIASFADEPSAALASGHVLDAGLTPVALEFMDALTVASVEAATKVGFPAGSRGIVLAKFHGTPEEVDQDARRCSDVLKSAGAIWRETAFHKEDASGLWRARHMAYPSLARICPTLFGEDCVVPRRHFADTVARYGELSLELDVPIAMFAHAGDGNIHPLLLTDDSDSEQRKKNNFMIEALVKEAISRGGAVTGEHGIGLVKSHLVSMQYGDEEIAAMRRVKSVFDPRGLFNPMIFPITGHIPNARRRPQNII